jgi:hypothetical protein
MWQRRASCNRELRLVQFLPHHIRTLVLPNSRIYFRKQPWILCLLLDAHHVSASSIPRSRTRHDTCSLGPGARAATGGAQSAWIHFFPVKNQVLQFWTYHHKFSVKLKVPVMYLDIKSDRFKNAKIGGVNGNVGQLIFWPEGSILGPEGFKGGTKLSDMALFKKFRELTWSSPPICVVKTTKMHVFQQPLGYLPWKLNSRGTWLVPSIWY